MAELFSTTERDGVFVLQVEVEVFDLVNGAEFDRQLLAWGDRPGGKILLDLTKVSYLHSMVLGTLGKFRNAVVKSGGTLRLVGLRPEVREVFTMTRLNTLFEIFETVGEAVDTAWGE